MKKQIVKTKYLKSISYVLVVILLFAFNMSVSADMLGQWLLNEDAKDTSGNGNDGEIIGKAN